MLTAALAALAASGGTALVAVVATDAFSTSTARWRATVGSSDVLDGEVVRVSPSGGSRTSCLRGNGRFGEQISKHSATPLLMGRSWLHAWQTSVHRRRCFNGYPAILVRLDRTTDAELEELLVEAWLARAPKRLAKEYTDAST